MEGCFGLVGTGFLSFGGGGACACFLIFGSGTSKRH